MQTSQQGFIAPLLLVLIALLLIGGGAYVYVHNRQANQSASVDQTTQATSTSPANWKTYANSEIGFQFSYPSDFVVTETSRENYFHVSVADPDSKPYLSVDVFTKPSVEDKTLFVGPFPKTISGGNESNQSTVTQKTLNGLVGVESFGRGGGGEGFQDSFEYIGRYLWVIRLNPVIEGRVSLNDALEIVGSTNKDRYLVNEDIYHQILKSFKIEK